VAVEVSVAEAEATTDRRMQLQSAKSHSKAT